MTAARLPTPPESDFLFYRTEDGKTRVRVLLAENTIWMPQKQIAEIYGVSVAAINQHIRNIMEEMELAPAIKEYLITAADGKLYQTMHYNLPMILAVGYRVRSARGTQFRQWATRTLEEFLVKGFVLDDERLKSCENAFGEDYFEELLERIRDISSSERRFYQKITDIYATAVDYSKDAEETQTFFATVQNKLHWAITGQTAPEIIAGRADPEKPHMEPLMIHGVSREVDARRWNRRCSHYFDDSSNAADARENFTRRVTGHETVTDFHIGGYNTILPVMNHSGGLRTWRNAPHGAVRKADVTVAKNYLDEGELSELNRIVTMYLDYAEMQATRRRTMTMREWAERLDAFLRFNESEILTDAGRVSREVAESLAHGAYETYRAGRIEATDATPSDFDRFARGLLKKPEGDDEE